MVDSITPPPTQFPLGMEGLLRVLSDDPAVLRENIWRLMESGPDGTITVNRLAVEAGISQPALHRFLVSSRRSRKRTGWGVSFTYIMRIHAALERLLNREIPLEEMVRVGKR